MSNPTPINYEGDIHKSRFYKQVNYEVKNRIEEKRRIFRVKYACGIAMAEV